MGRLKQRVQGKKMGSSKLYKGHQMKVEPFPGGRKITLIGPPVTNEERANETAFRIQEERDRMDRELERHRRRDLQEPGWGAREGGSELDEDD